MQVLHNQISNKELKKRMLEEKEPRATISFYNIFISTIHYNLEMNSI